MDEHGVPYSFDLNLDFLDSATTNTKIASITPGYQEQSQINLTYDIESLANRIATVNDMTIKIKATKDDNLRLQKQMQELSESAMSIRRMYDQEKAERSKFEKLYEEMQENYKQVESQLANKTLHFDQLQSRMELEAEDKKPIAYNDLALKYQRLCHKLEEEKQLPSKEKINLQLVKEYLDSNKLSPLPVFKKKSQSRVKCEVRDFGMQYNVEVKSKSQEIQCSLGYPQTEKKDTCTQTGQNKCSTTTQGTNTINLKHSKIEMKTQGTQYISSTTTRGTSTSTFIKTQSVGTNFPEPVAPVSIEDIFKEMICDVSPLSPLSASPQTELKEEKVETKSTGMCTEIKNVRKPIDYVAANIKHSDSRPPSRNTNHVYDRVKHEIPLIGMPIMNPFAGLGMPISPSHSTVVELWNLLGQTIFALLQQNGGTPAAPQINPIIMNTSNDRIKNISGRERSANDQQRSSEQQSRDDYFDQEYLREYPTTTRSVATSPILSPELQIHRTQSIASFETATNPYEQMDIKKIVLNRNFSDPVVSSSKKLSRVDEILQLFPEYSDSFKKRKAIKRLLKEVNKDKKKSNSTSCSSSSSVSASSLPTSEFQNLTPSSGGVSAPSDHECETPKTKSNLQENWENEIFGDCESDSSLEGSIIDYNRPIETKSPVEDPEWPISNSNNNLKPYRNKSPIEKQFLEFDDETNLPTTSDQIYSKSVLAHKQQNSSFARGSFMDEILERKEEDSNTTDDEQAKHSNRKRKRKGKKEDITQKNKIYKCEALTLPEIDNPKPEFKLPKSSLMLSRNKPELRSIPLIKVTTHNSDKKPLRSLSLNKMKKGDGCSQSMKELEICHEPEWNNNFRNIKEKEELSVHVARSYDGPKVMKVEKPPASVFEDIKTCFSNRNQDISNNFHNSNQERNLKSLISLNQTALKESADSTKQSTPCVTPTDDGTFRFLRNHEGTNINSSQNSNISSECLSYYQPKSAEKDFEVNSKPSAIVNEQWITETNSVRKTNDWKEDSRNINTPDSSPNSLLNSKTLDIENIPIYFLDDQKLLQTQVQNIEDTQQGPASLVPEFHEIQQVNQSPPTNLIASLNSDFQKEDLQITRPEKWSIDQRYSGDMQKSIEFSTIDCIPVKKGANPDEDKNSYFLLNKNKNVMVKSHALNFINGPFRDVSKSLTSTNETHLSIQGTEDNTSDLLKQNQMLLRTTASNETSLTDNQKVTVVQNAQPPISVQTLSNRILPQQVFKTPDLERIIATSETNISIVGNPSQEESLEDQISFKKPIPSKKEREAEQTCSSDSECDLSIDFPPSPESNNMSLLDLTTILKTPNETHNSDIIFKTPDSYSSNGNLITNSTEKLVEEYLLNESPGEEGPKFQIFLDRILDDVAPPSSPISAIAPSENQHNSDTEYSCDENPKEMTTPVRYKRKGPATSAIAVKRSTRHNSKKVGETTNMVNGLNLTIPNIELGKYTKKTEEQLIEPEKVVVEPMKENIVIPMGFFKETIEEEDEEPTCEPIRRHIDERIFIRNENFPEKVMPDIGVHKINQDFNTKEYEKTSFSQIDSCLSLCKQSKESMSLDVEVDESSASSVFCDESPASPPPIDQMPTELHTVPESFELSPILKKNYHLSRNTIISYLISNYNKQHHNMLNKGQQQTANLLERLQCLIKGYLNSMCLAIDTIRFLDSVLQLTRDDKIVARAMINILKVAPRPEMEVTGPIPDTYLSQTHCKLLNLLQPLSHHFPSLNRSLQSTLEQTLFTFTKQILSIECLVNLTQFYLAIINNPTGETNPARLFICKCLYFFNLKAVPMIYHTLCVYPTVLPKRLDSTYDRSDILISTIQSILMSTYYDPEKCDIMTKPILAKLRLFYNYESFKPPRDEVIENIMAKIRAGRSKNVAFALSLICKRMEQNQTEKFILNERLMPLANEFYHTLSQSSENDEKIACVLECISYVIKPFDMNTDISQYVNLFGRFLNAANNRKVVQEAAVAAILRTARFGYVQCFNAVYNFKPTYELSEYLKLMLRSFVYKKGIVFLQALERQAQELLAT